MNEESMNKMSGEWWFSERRVRWMKGWWTNVRWMISWWTNVRWMKNPWTTDDWWWMTTMRRIRIARLAKNESTRDRDSSAESSPPIRSEDGRRVFRFLRKRGIRFRLRFPKMAAAAREGEKREAMSKNHRSRLRKWARRKCWLPVERSAVNFRFGGKAVAGERLGVK